MSAKKLIFGFHAVASRIRQSSQGVGCIYFDQDRRDQRARDLLRQAESLGLRIIQVERKRLDGMAGNNRHQGVIAEVTAEVQAPLHDVGEVLNALSEPPLLLVLDGVQDPHNLGACLRVADAMGAHAVIAPKDRAVGLTPTVRKVASGAAEAIPFITVINLARTLKELKEDWGIWIVGTDDEAEGDITSARLDGPTALVMGAEGEGMRRLTRENCDLLVQIPMFGSVESLNVSVASGICLYEARRQRLAAS